MAHRQPSSQDEPNAANQGPGYGGPRVMGPMGNTWPAPQNYPQGQYPQQGYQGPYPGQVLQYPPQAPPGYWAPTPGQWAPPQGGYGGGYEGAAPQHGVPQDGYIHAGNFGYEIPAHRGPGNTRAEGQGHAGFDGGTEENVYHTIDDYENDPLQIKVTNLPKACSEDMLINYFESKRNFDTELRVDHVDIYNKSSEAVVTFEDSFAVQVVLDRQPCRLSGTTLKIEVITGQPESSEDDSDGGHDSESADDSSDGEDQDDGRTVEVQGFPKSVSKDMLQLYFESRKASDGGDIATVSVDRDNLSAVITFESAEVARRVLRKKQHKLERKVLSVKPYIISKADVLLANLPEELTEETLANFVEAKFKARPKQMCFNEDRSKVLLRFDAAVEFQKISDVCNQRKLCGQFVRPQQVPVTNCVIVTNIPDNPTEDMFRYFFENKKHGDADVDRVDMNLEEGYCIVYFTNVKDVDKVCDIRVHQLSGKKLGIQPYHSCLGAPYRGGGGFQVPADISLLDLDPYIVKFLHGSEEGMTDLSGRLLSIQAQLISPATQTGAFQVACTLTDKVKGFRKLAKSWLGVVMETVQDYSKTLLVQKKEFDEEMWREVLTEIQSVDIDRPDRVVVVLEQASRSLILVGYKSEVDGVWGQLMSIFNKVAKEVKERKLRVTERKTVKQWQAYYLLYQEFCDEMKATHENLQIDLDVKSKVIKLQGQKGTVTKVLSTMYERLSTVSQRKISGLASEELELLKNSNPARHIRKCLREQGVSDVWEVRSGAVLLYGDSDDVVSQMEQMIRRSLRKIKIPLDDTSRRVLKSAEWKKTSGTLKQQYPGGVVFKSDERLLEVYTTENHFSAIKKELEQFISANTVYTEDISLDWGVAAFIKTHLSHRLREQTDKEVKVSFSQDGKVTLEGTRDGIRKMKQVLQQLTSEVVSRDHTLKTPGVERYMRTEKGKVCIEQIERSIPCVIKLKPSGLGSSWGKPSGGPPGRRPDFNKVVECAQGTLRSGVVVTVTGGDMTELQGIDVIVNAANSKLEHAGGLAAAILRKGGRQIQDECHDRVRQKKPLSAGDVFLGGAGSLPYKAIAHAVGPKWEDGSQGEDTVLTRAVTACLEKTQKHGHRSIAIPALSTGMFGYPVGRACSVIVEAVNTFCSKPQCRLKKVYLCDVAAKTIKAFCDALGAVTNNVQVMASPSQEATYQAGPEVPEPRSRSVDSQASGGPFGSVSVSVVKAELAKEKGDALVNSASRDLQLQKGHSSRAVLKAAGQELQRECDQKFPDGIQTGDLAVTDSYGLRCKKVFHVAISSWDSRRGGMRELQSVMNKCLAEAQRRSFSTISFPALGTGAQKYPKDKVAHEMFMCVANFCQNNPGSLSSVRFVIYPSDDDTLEAFLTEETKWTKTAGFPQGAAPRMASSGNASVVKVTTGAGEFRIGRLAVKVYQGDITDERTDGIVASGNRDLDLTKGAVTKAIVKKGGKSIEQECQNQVRAMKQDGIVVTSAGQLPARHIIFVDTKYKTWEWKRVVVDSLKKAEEHQMTSVAFPALGTSVGCKPGDIAGVMCTAMEEFLQGSCRHLTNVCVVIFQDSHVDQFIHGMATTIQGSKSPGSGARPRESFGAQHHRGGRSMESAPAQGNTTHITIFSDGKSKLDNAVKSLERTIKNEWLNKEVKDELIHSFHLHQIQKIKDSAKKHNCLVEIDTERGILLVQGLCFDAMNVIDEVNRYLRVQEQSIHTRGLADLLKNMVKWFYIKDNKLYPFPDRDNLTIETENKAGKKTVRIKDRSGGEYEVDFGSMEEHDVKNPKVKFPVVRRYLISDVKSEIPKGWKAMKPEENLLLVDLSPSDKEYKDVVAEFQKTLQRTPQVSKVQRIQNQTLYAQYAAKKKQMDQQNTNVKNNERVLWHGTAADAIDSINHHGFNRSYCGKNAVAIGNGVYFAVSAAYSDQGKYAMVDSAGNKRIYRTLVLTGDFCPGQHGLRTPPQKSTSQSHILYDSVTNSVSRPDMFVIFNDTQAYPDHLITYR